MADLTSKLSDEPKKKKRTERLREVREAFSNGASTTKDLSIILGISRRHVLRLVGELEKRDGLDFGLARTPENHNIRKLRKLVAEGKEMAEIVEELNLKQRYIRELAREGGITPPKYDYDVGEPFDPKKDRLIRRGLSLVQIAEKQRPPISREKIRVYIIESGQYSKWRQSREVYKKVSEREIVKRNQIISGLVVGKIKNELKKMVKRGEDTRHHIAALKYRDSTIHNKKNMDFTRYNISYERLLEFFGGYYDALDRGEKLSLAKLGEGSGMSHTHAKAILERVGLEPMYGKREFRRRKKKS